MNNRRVQTAPLSQNLLFMKVEDLKGLIRKFDLGCNLTGTKSVLASAIAGDDKLRDDPGLRQRIANIADMFAGGDQHTTIIHRLRSPICDEAITSIVANWTSGRVENPGGIAFRLNEVVAREFRGKPMLIFRFAYPGGQRVVEDFTRGELSYVPAVPAACAVWEIGGEMVFDSRVAPRHVTDLVKCTKRVICNAAPTISESDLTSTKIVPDHYVMMKLKAALGGVSKRAQWSQMEELRDDVLYPRSVELKSENYDLVDHRDQLQGVSSGAEYDAEGLEFPLTIDGFEPQGAYRVFIHFGTGAIMFPLKTPMGVFYDVIKAVLEADNERTT